MRPRARADGLDQDLEVILRQPRLETPVRTRLDSARPRMRRSTAPARRITAARVLRLPPRVPSLHYGLSEGAKLGTNKRTFAPYNTQTRACQLRDGRDVIVPPKHRQSDARIECARTCAARF